MSEQIEVTQVDRERAATMCVGDFTAEEFRARLHDDHFVVQNLAAHRIAAEQAAAATITELRAENARLRADNAALVEGAEARGYARGIREAADIADNQNAATRAIVPAILAKLGGSHDSR
jgi:hypothetical protein